MDREKSKKKILSDRRHWNCCGQQHTTQNRKSYESNFNEHTFCHIYPTIYTKRQQAKKKLLQMLQDYTEKHEKIYSQESACAHYFTWKENYTKVCPKSKRRKTHNKVSLKNTLFCVWGMWGRFAPKLFEIWFSSFWTNFRIFPNFLQKKREKIFSTDFWGWDVEFPTHVASNGISTLRSTLRLKNFFWPKIVQNLLNFSKCWKCPRNCFSSIFGAGTLNFQTMKVHTVLQLFRSPWRFFWWSFFFAPNPWK